MLSFGLDKIYPRLRPDPSTPDGVTPVVERTWRGNLVPLIPIAIAVTAAVTASWLWPDALRKHAAVPGPTTERAPAAVEHAH